MKDTPTAELALVLEAALSDFREYEFIHPYHDEKLLVAIKAVCAWAGIDFDTLEQ